MASKTLERLKGPRWAMLCVTLLALLGLTTCAGTPPAATEIAAPSPSPSPTATHTPASEPAPARTLLPTPPRSPEPPSTPTPWPKVSGPVEITMDPGPAEGDETTVCVKDLLSEMKVLCLTLTDVDRNHDHPAEYHDGVLYVLKEVGDDERPGAAQTDELWAYTAPNEGTKLSEDPGLDSFRAAPDHRYVAIAGGPQPESLRFLDPKGETVRTLTADELRIADPKVRDPREPRLGLEAWADDGSAFWIHDHAGPSPQAFVKIDVESWTITQYDISDLTIPAEYALNPDTGWMVYSDCPAIYDAPAAEAFAESDQEVTLSVYDLDAGTGQDLTTVEARRFNRESMALRCFNLEWVDNRTVTYDGPGDEGQIAAVVAEH